jgi:putative salt-induced outer membrane protein
MQNPEVDTAADLEHSFDTRLLSKEAEGGIVRSRYLSMVLVVLSSFALADQVVLTNGDRLTGQFVKFDGKILTVKTDYAGDVDVQWSAVQQITSDQPLRLSSSSGQTAAGPVTTRDGKFQIATKTSGTIEIPKEDVTSLQNESAYEKSLHPAFYENWDTGATVAFALTRGNSQTKNLALAFNGTRKTLHDKLSLYTNSVFATNDAPGAIPGTTANAQQGGIRYDHDLTDRVFAFVGADFQADSLQTLDLRSVFGGGIGFHVIKRDSTTLDFFTGANYTHEKYTAFSRNFAAATLGDEFMHKLYGSTVLTQSLYFYPDFNNTGEYRGTFNFGTITKISKWLGWQNAFGDIYVSNPPFGKKKNDILLTTGAIRVKTRDRIR